MPKEWGVHDALCLQNMYSTTERGPELWVWRGAKRSNEQRLVQCHPHPPHPGCFSWSSAQQTGDFSGLGLPPNIQRSPSVLLSLYILLSQVKTRAKQYRSADVQKFKLKAGTEQGSLRTPWFVLLPQSKVPVCLFSIQTERLDVRRSYDCLHMEAIPGLVQEARWSQKLFQNSMKKAATEICVFPPWRIYLFISWINVLYECENVVGGLLLLCLKMEATWMLVNYTAISFTEEVAEWFAFITANIMIRSWEYVRGAGYRISIVPYLYASQGHLAGHWGRWAAYGLLKAYYHFCSSFWIRAPPMIFIYFAEFLDPCPS